MPSTTPAENNKMHDLSPGLRNQGPDSHKDNSKQMGKVHSEPKTKDDKKTTGKENDDVNEGNKGNDSHVKQ